MGPEGGFVAGGLKREAWSAAELIWRIFRRAFERAGLPYFKPYALRDTLVQFGARSCRSPVAVKPWSQNLGDEQVMTTSSSDGTVASHRQATLGRSAFGCGWPATAIRSVSAERTYILITRRITSGELSKCRNGLVIARR